MNLVHYTSHISEEFSFPPTRYQRTSITVNIQLTDSSNEQSGTSHLTPRELLLSYPSTIILCNESSYCALRERDAIILTKTGFVYTPQGKNSNAAVSPKTLPSVLLTRQ